MQDVDRDLEKLRLLLRKKIEESGLTQTEIQRRCGWDHGSLSKMLISSKTMKVGMVLTLLDVLGVEPGRFFGQLYDIARRESGEEVH